MKACFRHLLLFLLFLSSLPVAAQDEPVDTVYFYASWEQVFNMQPDVMLVDLTIDVYSPFEIYFNSTDKNTNNKIKKEYLVAMLSDSTWLVNSNYLKAYFKGDSKKLHGYVPLTFTDKVAYAVAEDYFYAEIAGVGYSVFATNNYYIDFAQRKVFKLDAKALSTLLADYPDLRMRYEGLKDNDSSAILNDFFIRYIDRADNDDLRPTILDLVEEQGLLPN